MKITTEQILEAAEADDNRGFCLACGEEAFGVEPDARGYTCDCCGKPKVAGVGILLGC